MIFLFRRNVNMAFESKAKDVKIPLFNFNLWINKTSPVFIFVSWINYLVALTLRATASINGTQEINYEHNIIIHPTIILVASLLSLFSLYLF
jgi:hypothetical protein